MQLCQRGDEAVAVGLVAEAFSDRPVDRLVGGGGGGCCDDVGGGGGGGGHVGDDGVPSILRKVIFERHASRKTHSYT